KVIAPTFSPWPVARPRTQSPCTDEIGISLSSVDPRSSNEWTSQRPRVPSRSPRAPASTRTLEAGGVRSSARIRDVGAGRVESGATSGDATHAGAAPRRRAMRIARVKGHYLRIKVEGRTADHDSDERNVCAQPV